MNVLIGDRFNMKQAESARRSLFGRVLLATNTILLSNGIFMASMLSQVTPSASRAVGPTAMGLPLVIFTSGDSFGVR